MGLISTGWSYPNAAELTLCRSRRSSSSLPWSLGSGTITTPSCWRLMTARPVAHAQSHLAALETASSSDTTSDLRQRASRVSRSPLVRARLAPVPVPHRLVQRSPSCSASQFVRSACCRKSSGRGRSRPPSARSGPDSASCPLGGCYECATPSMCHPFRWRRTGP